MFSHVTEPDSIASYKDSLPDPYNEAEMQQLKGRLEEIPAWALKAPVCPSNVYERVKAALRAFY